MIYATADEDDKEENAELLFLAFCETTRSKLEEIRVSERELHDDSEILEEETCTQTCIYGLRERKDVQEV